MSRLKPRPTKTIYEIASKIVTSFAAPRGETRRRITHEGRPRIMLRFLRRAPEERRHVEVIRDGGVLLVDDFAGYGTRVFLHDLLRLNELFLAPSLPRLRQ